MFSRLVLIGLLGLAGCGAQSADADRLDRLEKQVSAQRSEIAALRGDLDQEVRRAQDTFVASLRDHSQRGPSTALRSVNAGGDAPGYIPPLTIPSGERLPSLYSQGDSTADRALTEAKAAREEAQAAQGAAREAQEGVDNAERERLYRKAFKKKG